MYHIAKDKRSQESAMRIRNGLHACLLAKPLCKISVSELCEKASVSRATFYRLFDIITDVVRWSTDCQCEIMCEMLQHSDTFPQQWPFKFCLRYIYEHNEVLEMALRANRVDIADESFQRHLKPLLSELRQKHQVSAQDWLYASGIVSSIIVAVYKTWQQTGCHETIDELCEKVHQILPHIR